MNKHLSHKKADDRDPSVRALEEDLAHQAGHSRGGLLKPLKNISK